jgi:hypothetical protein
METEPQNKSENFFQELKDVGIKHFNNKLEWTKLVAIEKGSKIIGALAAVIILGIIGFFLLAYASLMLGFLFTSLLGSPFYGFGLVAIILLTVFLIVKSKKKQWIEIPVMNMVIQILLENDGESKDI